MHIEHIAIWTKNLDQLKAFYETYFQAKANQKYVNPKNQFESYFLTFEDNPTRLELMQKPDIPISKDDSVRQFTGLVHIAFSLGSENRVNALTDKLRKDGFRVLDGPRRTGDGYYESCVLDPDGNRIEITV